MRKLKYAVTALSIHLISFISAALDPTRLIHRESPVSPGVNCSSITTYANGTANITILGPNGRVLGGSAAIQLPETGWFSLDSALPYTLALMQQKTNLVLQYSNDQSWTVQSNKPTTNLFDCRQFKFWLHTNFWTFSGEKTVEKGSLNWTIVALDGTKLGGAPQTDIIASKKGFTSLPSLLDKTVDVYWNEQNIMTFRYEDQTANLLNAIGLHSTELIGSAPVNLFSWTTSGIL